MHECWHMFTYGKYKRMNVETSKHDQLWTTRRQVTINVESLTWNVDDGDQWWDADWLSTTSAVPLPTDWRRPLRTPRMTATVTVMTYAATCHSRTVMHGWCTCSQPRTRTPIILVHELWHRWSRVHRRCHCLTQSFTSNLCRRRTKSKKQNIPQ